MHDVFYDFEWSVAPEYEWQDWLAENGTPIVMPAIGVVSPESARAVEVLWNRCQKEGLQYGPVLHAVLPKDDAELRRYRPMDRQHATLFREFGDLDYTSQTSVMGFARSYGLLGVTAPHQRLKVPGADGELRYYNAKGEPFLNWAVEIALMREGILLSGQKRTFEMTRRLKGLFDRNLQHVQGRLGFNPAGEPKLDLEPLDLIAALWLQLALAITGDKQFVACKFCGRMFEISTEHTGFRRHRKFCTQSCKTNDYRKRKQTVSRLAESGAEVSEIADKTKTKAATVRSWLRAAKGVTRRKSTKET